MTTDIDITPDRDQLVPAEEPTTELAEEERDALMHAEAQIARGLQTFYEVGEALLTIRDNRLYREDYSSFETYCRQRWDMSNRHANRLIQSADVMLSMREAAADEDQLVLPVNEAQTRELAKAEPEDRLDVWQETQGRTGLEQPPAREVTVTNDARSDAPHPGVAIIAKGLARIKGGKMADHMGEARELHARGVTADDAYPVDGDSYSTPDKIINRVRETFEGGVIDLDPATHTKAQKLIQAVDHFTIDDDGLKQEWYGRVWLNPPYSSVGPWIDKLYDDVMHDRVSEAMVIVNIDVGRQWWAKLVDMGRAHATPFERVQFWHPDERATIGNNRHSQAVFYIGTEAGLHRFAHAFEFDWDVNVPYKRMLDIERRNRSVRGVVSALIDPDVNVSSESDCETWAKILGALSQGDDLHGAVAVHVKGKADDRITWQRDVRAIPSLAWDDRSKTLRRDHQDLVARVLEEAER